MALVTRTSFSTGDIPTASEWNTQFDTIYNEFNGSISAANLDSDAVETAKIKDGDVTNAKLAVDPEITYETKLLSADLTANGTMSALTYTLTAATTYRITGQVVIFIASGDDEADMEIKDGATVIGLLINGDDDTSNSQIMTFNFSYIYTMVGTSLTFEGKSLGGGSLIRGNATRNETFVVVEKLANYIEGTVT